MSETPSGFSAGERSSNPASGSGVLRAARGSDDAALDAAIRRLIDDVLLPAAIRETRGRRDQVEFLPESLVQSVVADDLPQAIRACTDEEHLRAWLIRAIRHKVIDRTRKGGAHGAPLSLGRGHGRTSGTSVTGTPEPCDCTPGPQTRAMAREVAELDDTAFRAMSVRILAAARDATDRALLDGYVLRGLRWDAVAEAAGVTSVAARQRLSRLRALLLDAICMPLRPTLDGEAWAVAEALLLQRRSVERVGAVVGLDSNSVVRVCRQRVIPALAGLYGARGVDAILRLLGNRRIVSDG